ncbi:peptide ligase PGM1-related protein [Solwaraspora sp. WMMD792]|uniref:preATP grasp domain-containing protein n=1 Tax=Solwaraspora sp. WMMD792 TaxID=3016099 RepID=UPI0024173050|nr:peptide ligase PGM1-related protein [Solwaraspora sp. WMMD792]MDG4769201.1 peptide ligase PGM1-related protein [Solwaraspora sp. WMMD792]
MPKLMFANSTSRSMAARPDDVPDDAKDSYRFLANRMLWSMDEGDVAVLPGKVSDAWLAYVADLLGLASPPTVLSLGDYPGGGWYPGERPQLAEALRGFMAARGGGANPWRLECYIHDRDIASWERLLGIGAEESVRFAQGTAELVNSKSVFRSMATACGIPVAEGRVVDRGPELVDGVSELLTRTGAVIVKQDVNAGGDGNILLTTVEGGKEAGAHYVVHLAATDPATVASALEPFGLTALPDLPAGASPAHNIIEVYHESVRELSADMTVPRVGAPTLMSYSDLRMAETWKGSIYPPQNLTPRLHAHLGAYMQQVAIVAQQLGYYGPMNIDAIVTRSGDLLFNEFNGRVGGTTGIDMIGRRLLGQDYLDHHVFASRIDVPAPGCDILVKALDEQGLLFTRGSDHGVVIYNDTTEETGTIEYVVVGRSWAETSRTEEQLTGMLSKL